MNARRKRTTAIALAGSVALALGAYAIGSQTGGGTSDAASSEGGERVRAIGGAGPGGESLASRLGVSEAKLRAAFDDIKGEASPRGGDPRSGLEEALADALDLPRATVADALERLRANHEADESARRKAFAEKLAAELDIEASDVTKAFDELRPDRHGPRALGPPPGGRDGPGGPPPDGRQHRLRLAPPGARAGFLGDLAEKLGVKRSELRAALAKVRPSGPMGRAPGAEGAPRAFRAGPPPGFVDELAKELDVDSAAVESALEKVHAQRESRMQARHEKLASELAERLDLPVEKVKDALAAGPHGPHGPHGP